MLNKMIRLWPAIAGVMLALALVALLQINLAQAITQFKLHTTISDFNKGTFQYTGLSQTSDGEVTLLAVGIVGEWITTTNATNFVPRSEHAAIAANNRVYVFGGRTANNTLTSIQYATVNTLTHNLSNWITASVSLNTLYPGGVATLNAVYLNGYVYLMGGYLVDEATGITSTVSYAQIQSDGSLTPFIKTTSLPQMLSRSDSVVVNGRIYVIGGRGTDSKGRNTTYYAEPDPNTGAISAWITTAAQLPYPAYGHEAFFTNNRLYFAGGVSNTVATGGVVPNVYFATLEPNGDIQAGSWISTEVLPFPLYEAAAASFGGQLYSMGGSNSALLADSPSAFVGAALPLDNGQVITWVNSSVLYPARFAHAAVVNEDGWIYLIGGTVGSNAPIITSIINAGSTAGTGGSAYAQQGYYTSTVIDLQSNYTLQQLNWTTYLGDTSYISLTMRYRYRPASGAWSAWSASLPALKVTGVATTSYTLNQIGRYFQYEATFTSTNGLTTPMLTRVELRYDAPDPPLFLKQANPPGGSSVQAGARITYTLTYSNVSNAVLHSAIISDRVPLSTTYASGSIFASPGVTPDDSSDPFLIWDLGDLQPHTGGSIGYTVIVNPALPEGSVIQNIADFKSNEASIQSSAVTHIVGTPPVLIKTVGTSAPGQAGNSVQPNDLITYTLTYSNPSTTRTLTGAVITDLLALNLEYVSAFGSVQPDTSQLATQRLLRWNIGSIQPLSSASIGFVARVTSGVLNGSQIKNQGHISGNEILGVASNEVSTPVSYRFDLAITKSDGKTTANAGEYLTYTLRLTNTAQFPVTATGIIITDYIEPGVPGLTQTVLSFVGGTPGWLYVETDLDGNAIYSYPAGSLAANQTRVVTMVLRITNTLPIGVLAIRNSVEVLDSGQSGVELDPSNQIDSDTDIVDGPDLAVTGISLQPQRPGLNTPATVVVTVTNQGLDTALASDGYGWFWIDLYLKPDGFLPAGLPTSPHDRWGSRCLNAYNVPCTEQMGLSQTPLFQSGQSPPGSALSPGQSLTATFTLQFAEKKIYRLYAQADIEWPGICTGAYSIYNCGSPSNGRMVEGDESNNISGPLVVMPGAEIYLPIVFKNR